MVQGGGGSTSSNSDDPTSKQKFRSSATVRNHVTRDFHMQQVRAMPLVYEAADSSHYTGLDCVCFV